MKWHPMSYLDIWTTQRAKGPPNAKRQKITGLVEAPPPAASHSQFMSQPFILPSPNQQSQPSNQSDASQPLQRFSLASPNLHVSQLHPPMGIQRFQQWQAPVAPSNDDQSCGPLTPDPVPGAYVIGLIQFCHPNTRSCYGCSKPLRTQEINQMVIVSKTHREYWSSQEVRMVISPTLNRVYYHFNIDCLLVRDKNFLPNMLIFPNVLRPHLNEQQLIYIAQLGLLIL